MNTSPNTKVQNRDDMIKPCGLDIILQNLSVSLQCFEHANPRIMVIN